uniref:Cas12f1-like TNB domain-containing protein n=1 Tax=viral metagenome TaxID=1070528 RepID=A0A6C0C8Y2_9ZZZZ
MRKAELPQKANNTRTANSFTLSPIYTSNHECNVINWLSPLNTDIFYTDTSSWYESIEKRNFYEPIRTPQVTIDYPIIPKNSLQQQLKQIPKTKSNKSPGFIYTKKIRINPDNFQKFIFDQWFSATAKIFNITINIIQKRIFKNGKLIDFAEIKKILNARSVRSELTDQKNIIQKYFGNKIQERQLKLHKKQEEIQKKKIKMKINKGLIPIHVLDESISQAISNFKTCVSNFKKGHIKKFRIKPLKRERVTKILKLEANLFKNGTFCIRVFPNIESSEPLDGIEKTCTLQYSHITKKYILFTPTFMMPRKRNAIELSAGIDLGVTPFICAYSQNNTYSLCNMNNPNISRGVDRNQKKVKKLNDLISAKQISDNIVALKKKLVNNNDRSILNEIKHLTTTLDAKKKVLGDSDFSAMNSNKLKKGREKYNLRKQNMIKDMHFKTSYNLVHEYNDISIGKFCVKNLLTKENTVVGPRTKELMKILSPYAFQQRLKYMGYKYGIPVREVSEYLTTKTCSNCGRTKEMGGLKVYKCQCGIIANRDENSAKTHLKLGIMQKRSEKVLLTE